MRWADSIRKEVAARHGGVFPSDTGHCRHGTSFAAEDMLTRDCLHAVRSDQRNGYSGQPSSVSDSSQTPSEQQIQKTLPELLRQGRRIAGRSLSRPSFSPELSAGLSKGCRPSERTRKTDATPSEPGDVSVFVRTTHKAFRDPLVESKFSSFERFCSRL